MLKLPRDSAARLRDLDEQLPLRPLMSSFAASRVPSSPYDPVL